MQKSKKVLITGGTGLIGRELSKKLLHKGYEVAVLSRNKKKNAEIITYEWDPENREIEKDAIETSDYIIHLAGANISAKRWTKKRKQEIVESRVRTADLLFNKVKQTENKIKAFISASAINYYGTVTSDRIFSEDDPPASDFLGETCRRWEESAGKFKEHGIRTVIFRNGAVLSPEGGALPKMNIPVKMGVAAPIGSGKQYFPWIHMEDICNMYTMAVEHENINGIYNATAPGHTTNKNFMKTLARLQGKPFWAPNAPSSIVKIALGEMAMVILEGSRISSQKIQSAGFKFGFPDLESALIDSTEANKIR